MSVRPGTAEDLEACKTLAYYAMSESESYRDVTPEFELLTRQILSDPSYALFVSEREDESVNGFLLAQLQRGLFFRENIATNVAFYVLPQRRGSMTPYLLVKEFERWARENKVSQIHLSTSGGINLRKNMRFFDGLGYRISGVLAIKRITT